MKAIKVYKDDLLDSLVANRKIHIAEYKEAKESYRKVVIAWFKEQTRKAKAKQEFETYYNAEPEPSDHTEDYNLAIDMLEMSTDEEIVLDQVEFRQYVQDEWSWQHSFKESASFYNVTSASL